MFDLLLKVLVLKESHKVYVDRKVVALRVHFLEIPESRLLLRLSAVETVKVNNRPVVYECKYRSLEFKATFFHDCMVIQ